MLRLLRRGRRCLRPMDRHVNQGNGTLGLRICIYVVGFLCPAVMVLGTSTCRSQRRRHHGMGNIEELVKKLQSN